MSASTTPFLVKTQPNEMKLVLTKDSRAVHKVPSDSSDTPPTSMPKSVIREAPSKQDIDSSCMKPIVIPPVPPVPKLISMVSKSKGQSTLAQFFPSKSMPPASNTAHLNAYTSSSYKHVIDDILKNRNPLKQGGSTSVPKSDTRSPGVPPSTVHKKRSPSKQREVTVVATAQGVPTGHKVAHPISRGELATTGSSVGNEVHPPKPKRAKTTISTTLPQSRVKTIMKTNIQSSQTTVNTGLESVAVISKAAELFIAELAKRSLESTKEQNVQSVTYNHLAETVQKGKDLHFLHTVVPKKVLAKDILTPHNSTDTTQH